jgi:hypothetical protein
MENNIEKAFEKIAEMNNRLAVASPFYATANSLVVTATTLVELGHVEEALRLLDVATSLVGIGNDFLMPE